MKANTAAAFVLAGLSLFLLDPENSTVSARARRLGGRAAAAATALLGAMTLAEYLLHRDLGLDLLLFPDASSSIAISPPGRMAPHTAFNFVLLGGALLLLDLETRKGHRPGQFLALVAAVISAVAAIGYTYSVASLYKITSYTGMALHTSLTFLVLSLGVLSVRPDRGLTALLFAGGPGGIMARRLIPAAFLVPVVLGWLRLEGQRAGLYGTEVGTGLMVISTVVALMAVLYGTALAMERSDALRRRAEEGIRRLNAELEERVLERTEQLKESRSRLASILDSVGEGVVVADRDGKFVLFNPAAERILGLGATETDPAEWPATYGAFQIDGKTPFPAEELPLVQAIRGESPDDVEMFIRNPQVPEGAPISLSGRPIRDAEGQLRGGVVVFRDISQRKRAEAALKESEARLQLALESAAMGMWDLDLLHDTAVRSLRHDQIFGYSTLQPEWGAEIFMSHLLPEDREPVRARFEAAFTSGELDMECRVRWPDETVHWIAARGHVYRDESGKPERMMGVVADATERKRAEQTLAERSDQLVAANRELEAFSYSVSHDLRAPLRHIGGFAELLNKSAASALGEKERRYLQTISDAATKMGCLIDDLLVFSRMGRAEMRSTWIDLGNLVAEAQNELRNEMGGRDVVWRLHGLGSVRGDPALLRQALVNLLSNALKYSRPRPRAEIDIGTLPDGSEETVVFVKDNGVGFDMRYVDKLFGVFQRLHPSEEFDGTGIGLANVRRIIHRHGGRTWAEGAVDQGATFYFSLPNAEKGES